MLSTFGFVDDVIFSYHLASGSESSTALCLRDRQVAVTVRQLQCLGEFMIMLIRWQSLLSMSDLFSVCVLWYIQDG